jgi:predicted amidophosphoribosyltransferase
MDEHSPSSVPTPALCLTCEQPVTPETQRCEHCGATLDGVSLYNPKHFIWLAFLLSGVVPISMAATCPCSL